MTVRNTVSLIGAHTLGRMFQLFSGFAGAWVPKANIFDNLYFKHLWGLKWVRDEVRAGPLNEKNGKIAWVKLGNSSVEHSSF